MAVTPRNSFPYPDEREQPYYQNFVAGVFAEDAAMWANADNGNLLFRGGGTFTWDSGTGALTWSTTITVTGKADAFAATIAAGSIVIADGEVAFFQMPRLLTATTAVLLRKANRISLAGTRLHDLRLFALRDGTKLWFPGQIAMDNGYSGPLFDIAVSTPHVHQAPVYHTPGAGLTGPFAIGYTSGGSPALEYVDVFRNGLLQRPGAGNDYTVDLVAGTITLLVATVAGETITILPRTV